MSDRRYKAWLLEHYIDGGTHEHFSDNDFHSFLELLSAAVVPRANPDDVKRRINNHIDERLWLTEKFMKLAYERPEVGQQFVEDIYVLARRDYSEDIRARAMAFLYHTDSNSNNTRQLINADHQMGLFSGEVSISGEGVWQFLDKPTPTPRRNSYPTEAAARLKKYPGSTLYRDYEEVFNSDDLDISTIGLPQYSSLVPNKS